MEWIYFLGPSNVQNACDSCHTLTSYDRTARGDYDGIGKIEGIQTEVKGLLKILNTAIKAKFSGITEDAATGRLSVTTASFNKMTTDEKGTIYNDNFVLEDRSYGVHNASYAVQLLQRSYYGVYGRPSSVDYPLMKLRGAVQPTYVGTRNDYE